MPTVDQLGHLGHAFIAAGTAILAYGVADHPTAFALRFVGETLWIVVGFRLRLPSVWAWGLGFAAVDAFGALG